MSSNKKVQDLIARDLPGIPRQCMIKIRSVSATLKNAELKALENLLRDPGAIANAGIVDFARNAGCSEATVSRLARRLGYDGYSDMRLDFGREEPQNEPSIYRGITGRDDSFTVVGKVFNASIQALGDTLTVMDHDACARAVDAYTHAGRLLFCGLGDANLVAMSAYQKFIRVNGHALAAEDPDLQLVMAGMLEKGDVVTAISHTGRSMPVLNVVAQARKRKATVVAITNFPYAPLAKRADIVLQTADFAEHIGGEVISKRVTELCVIESLFTNYLLRRRGAMVRKLDRSNEAVQVNKI